jgi:hypothetical protein
MNNFKKQFSWQDRYFEDVAGILGRVFFVRSSFLVDTEQATDLMVLQTEKMHTAIRLRKLNNYGNKYLNEFTIRAKTKFNKKTEIHKILNGFADYGFYGWVCDETKTIKHWTIFSFDIFRKTFNEDVLKGRSILNNPDGSGFYVFNFDELAEDFVIKTNIGE